MTNTKVKSFEAAIQAVEDLLQDSSGEEDSRASQGCGACGANSNQTAANNYEVLEEALSALNDVRYHLEGLKV